MKIKCKDRKGVQVLTLSGSMQHGDHDSEMVRLVGSSLAKGSNMFVIDLGKVKYFYSTALGSLLTCYRMVEDAGGMLVLARSTRKISSIMIQTKLIRFFKNYDSVPEAIDVLSSQVDRSEGSGIRKTVATYVSHA